MLIPEDEKTVINSINSGRPFIGNTKFIKNKLEKSIETLCKTLEL
ncbi:hypothetical protein PL321_01980 [Caloramator sp. mosi_1]|nr:hypothetical protein [Caloramator sp. mosi_1]WDC84537.1 hypothetical protein PL321_01980 [Caloramator sp. mosi_1]